jgi:type VI protein secretion system component Hcp
MIAVLGALAVMTQVVRADDANIYVDVTGLSCQGAGNRQAPGFTASSFSFGASTPASTTGGSTAGATSFADFIIVKGLDDCTPPLFGAAGKANHFGKVTVRVVPRTPPNSMMLLLITLENVVMTSDKFMEGAPGELDEQISLSYQIITITRVPSGRTFTLDRGRGLS